jgi:hypothetical protein
MMLSLRLASGSISYCRFSLRGHGAQLGGAQPKSLYEGTLWPQRQNHFWMSRPQPYPLPTRLYRVMLPPPLFPLFTQQLLLAFDLDTVKTPQGGPGVRSASSHLPSFLGNKGYAP